MSNPVVGWLKRAACELSWAVKGYYPPPECKGPQAPLPAAKVPSAPAQAPAVPLDPAQLALKRRDLFEELCVVGQLAPDCAKFGEEMALAAEREAARAPDPLP